MCTQVPYRLSLSREYWLPKSLCGWEKGPKEVPKVLEHYSLWFASVSFLLLLPFDTKGWNSFFKI